MKGSPQKDVGLDAKKASRPLLLGVISKNMFKQYDKLNSLKRKLVDKISNIWYPIFCLVQVGAIILLGLALGFTLEEIPSVTKNTENGAFLAVLVLLVTPLSAWVAWWVAALPFVFTGRLSLQELKGIMLNRYPKYWLEENL